MNDGMTHQEKQEIIQDACDSYQLNIIGIDVFREVCGRMGLNGTGIDELERFYRPPAPENENG